MARGSVHVYSFKNVICAIGSQTNAVLRKYYNLQKQSSGGYFFPLMIRDLGDNPQFTASKAWVSKPAPIVYGAKGGDQEWTIRCVGEFTSE